MKIVIAPNAFKNSATAEEAALAIERGLKRAEPRLETVLCPVGDGGDGTGRVLSHQLNAVAVDVEVKDPLGQQIVASFGWMADEQTAIIEMADASGLRLLKPNQYDPLRATSYGTGQLIKAAVEKGARKILLCIGGSATVDGGLGILTALGIRFYDAHGAAIHYPYEWASVADYETHDALLKHHEVEIAILCDVENPLLGADGAAAVFGPQKGANEQMVQELEKGLTAFRNLVERRTGRDIGIVKHGGAAGGVAAGLFGLLNARLVNGIDEVLKRLHFDKKLDAADWVITGEGSIDQQTLQGKAPFGVAQMAKGRGVPVAAFAGKIPSQPNAALAKWFDPLININPQPVPIAEALRQTLPNLEQTAFAFARRVR